MRRSAAARPWRLGLGGVAVASVGVLVAGCLPTPVTAEGRRVTELYAGFMAVAAGVAALIVGLTLFAVLRYRRRRDDDGRLPRQRHGDLRLEAAWTAIPVAIVLVLFAFTVSTLGAIEIDDPEASPTDVGASVDVTGFRWGWRFVYPDEDVVVEGIGEPGPEIVLPVGEPVRVRLTGEDVNHAFFVPAFLFKKDAIPGRTNVFEFTADTEGVYRGQCAEFCGLYHARMPFAVRVVPRAEYDAWIAERAGASPSLTTPIPSLTTPQPTPFAPEQSDLVSPGSSEDPEPPASGLSPSTEPSP